MQEHGRVRQIFEAPQNQEDVIKRYRRIESLFRQLQVSPTLHIQCAGLTHLQNDITLRTWNNARRDREVSTVKLAQILS